MGTRLSELSRVVSHALRHQPWLYELEVDDEGWTDINALVAALRHDSPLWLNLTEQDVRDMVTASPKQRHEVSQGRIRALYGHSADVAIRRQRAHPPRFLFHGTASDAAANIAREGLLPMGRQFVHLSADCQTAVAVGLRKSTDPVVLLVNSQEAWNAGIAFYRGNLHVWLADRVPAAYIQFGRRSPDAA